MDNTPNISDFFKLLEKKVLDSSFEERVLTMLEDINSKLEKYRKECLEYEEKKYFDEFIAVYKIPELLDGAASKRTVEYWLEKKLFPIIRIGKIRVVKRSDLNAFLEARYNYKQR